MSLKIRLSRAGSKKRPYYHIVIADIRSPRDGRFIERVGFWNPMLADENDRIKMDNERIQYWLSHGALPTDRVARFLDAAGLFKRKPRNNPNKALPGKKAQERIAAAKQAEEEAKAAVAAPAEEAAQPTE